MMRRIGLSLGLSVVVVSQAMAQYIGMPVADPGASNSNWLTRVTAMVSTFGDGTTFYGARAACGVTDDLRVFADVGRIAGLKETAVKIDEDFAGFGGQLGFAYHLPLDLGVDIALRGTVFKPLITSEKSLVSVEGAGMLIVKRDLDIVGGSAGLILGRSLDDSVKGLSWYGSAGANFRSTDLKWKSEVQDAPDSGIGGSDKISTSETIFGGVLGVFYDVNESVSLYAEAGWIDDVVASAGVNFTWPLPEED
jgi:hypothetical protein